MRTPVVRAFASSALIALIVAGAGTLPETRAAQQAVDTNPAPIARLVFTQVPVRPASASDLAPGSRIVSFDPSDPAREPTNLTPGFHAAGRPDVSFDGTRILFVARKNAGDPLDVWEMSEDGSDHRRITTGVGNCAEAVYLSTIYRIDDLEPVHQVAFSSDAAGGIGRALYTCRLDGTSVRQITFGPFGASDPYLLGDGRLLFSSAEAPGEDDERRAALWTVNTDGADVFVFTRAHDAPAWRSAPCETPDGLVVSVESPADDPDGGGMLVSVTRTSSLHTRRVLARDPVQRYRAPTPAGDGRLVVSSRRDGSASWGLTLLAIADGTGAGTVYDAPRWHELDAVVVRPRPEPPGRSSVVDDRLDTGLLYCLDASLSDADHAPADGAGSITALQVYTALGGDGGRDRVTEELLGTAPVEPDGSFHLRVPASTPLRLQTLDAEGHVIQSMRSWFWVMPKETRGCIGCHEDRELSPPNRHVLALRKGPHVIAPPSRTNEATKSH